MAYEDIDALSRMQAGQSRQVGAAAADLADPFATERGRYKGALRNFMDNPSGSPAYKFAYEQGLDAINRRAAATGKTGSGNYLADLMRFGQGLASQDYYKQGNFLARLAGVDSSSPAAAALSLTGGFNRGQDQDSISAVARALRGGGQQNQLQPQNWMQPMNQGGSSGTGLPSGGYSIPAPYSPYTGPGYLPSADAGTGYVSSDYGTTVFGNGGSAYSPTDMYAGADMGGYDFGGYDYGGYDYGGYDTGGYDMGGGYEDFGTYDYGGGEEY